MAAFRRRHHQYIATVLEALNADSLRQFRCYFGGGTAIALRFGEFRESVDIVFLVSDRDAYRELRQLLTGSGDITPLLSGGDQSLMQGTDLRIDQYGIRTRLQVIDAIIKFEIVLEGRIVLEPPGEEDFVCGVPTLTVLDLATSKLLANSDRWSDDGVFSRDLLDLAIMAPGRPLLRSAVEKASEAYGEAVVRDLYKAIEATRKRTGWLERCMESLAIDVPPAVVWQQVRQLERRLA